MAGKFLGSSLVLENLTDMERIIEISVDQEATSYDAHEILSPYNADDLPFGYTEGE